MPAKPAVSMRPRQQQQRPLGGATVRSLVLLLALALLLALCGADEEHQTQSGLPEKKKAARVVMRCNDIPRVRPPYTKLVAPVKFHPPPPSELDHILYAEFLGGCDLDRACVYDLVQAMLRGNDAYVQHYLAAGTVFYLPGWSKTPKSWLMKDVLNIFEHYNVSSSSYTLVHVADESAYWNSPDLISFYKEWKRVFRTTWHFSEEYTNLTKAGILHWLPIHHLRTPKLSPADVIPASKRLFNVTFRGNMKTNMGRHSHWKELKRELGKRNASMTGKVASRYSFSVDTSKGAYLEEMTNSRLCLGIKGISPECYRFYESLECGCIPLFIDSMSGVNYAKAFQPWKSKLMEVQWRKGNELPFLWVSNMKSFLRLYDELFLTGPTGLAKLDLIQRETMEWWGVAKSHFIGLYENAICQYNSSSLT